MKNVVSTRPVNKNTLLEAYIHVLDIVSNQTKKKLSNTTVLYVYKYIFVSAHPLAFFKGTKIWKVSGLTYSSTTDVEQAYNSKQEEVNKCYRFMRRLSGPKSKLTLTRNWQLTKYLEDQFGIKESNFGQPQTLKPTKHSVFIPKFSVLFLIHFSTSRTPKSTTTSLHTEIAKPLSLTFHSFSTFQTQGLPPP